LSTYGRGKKEPFLVIPMLFRQDLCIKNREIWDRHSFRRLRTFKISKARIFTTVVMPPIFGLKEEGVYVNNLTGEQPLREEIPELTGKMIQEYRIS